MAKNKIVANGNMTHEESTVHRVKRKRCGDILSVPVSRLENGLGHRVYQCNGCGTKWKFGASTDSNSTEE
tara:strand:+ start:372 stop:581 length:210 start_codon:yes stop_codon:yes gene_type:complete